MILLAHMLFGAAIGSTINSPYWAGFLALLSHYFLDLFPHVEYLRSTEASIENIKSKYFKIYLFDLAKVALDFGLGIFSIFMILGNQPIIYACALIAILPDFMTVVTLLFPNKLLLWHHKIHTVYVHYLTKQKKFSLFWRIFTQVLVVFISIFIVQ